MFLTTFDRKMYEEALREEGRDEMVEKCKEMSKTIEEIIKEKEEIAKEKEEIAKEKDALLKKHIESQRIQAEHLKAKGFSYEEVKEIMVGFGEEELERIYGE